MDKNINVLVLAYLGDSIYEIYIREYLIKKGIAKVNDLQKEAIKYVSAKQQCNYLKEMLANNFFNEEEKNIIMRARNHKGSSHPKNTDIVTYKYATGLEALIGYLYLNNNKSRIDDIMKYIIGDEECMYMEKR
ncbi:MAG: ribonuclease III [Mollicutes bacterium]|nr:ribonuclease III [Mollicutes bacterium]